MAKQNESETAVDAEIEALDTIVKALLTLNDEAVLRVMSYLSKRFRVSVTINDD